MGSTKLFNIPANKLVPGPTLHIVRQPDGMLTATMDFTCRKFDYAKTAIQNLLNQGTKLITLYPQAGLDFDGIYLDDWDAKDAPGGITTVSCRFKGIVGSAEYSNDDNVTYTRNNSMRDDSILNHPKYLEQVTGSTRETIRLGMDGKVYNSGDHAIVFDGTNAERETLTDENHIWWWDYIIERKNDTYVRATSEWTKSASGRGRLPASKMTDFGKIDTPPGSPSAPSGDVWLYTGATENISIVGDTVNSYSQTWTSGSWEPTRVYLA